MSVGQIASGLWQSASTALATPNAGGANFDPHPHATKAPAQDRWTRPNGEAGAAASQASNLAVLMNQHNAAMNRVPPTQAAGAYARVAGVS